MALKVGVNGACGRMGLTVGRLICEDEDLELNVAIESADNPAIGKDYGVLLGRGNIGVIVESGLSNKINVLIDFSTPSATIKRVSECMKLGVPIVIGTTGLTDSDMSNISKASKNIPCIVSSNMSIGVNLLFRICPDIAKVLGNGYDIEIVESHHRFKKDAPSGTAKMLKENILKSGYKKDLPVHSIRAGDIVGEHSVVYSTVGETIEVTHRAHSRDIFARGAIIAAKFLAQAKPGLYTMRDLVESP